jgi:hypothetical protein
MPNPFPGLRPFRAEEAALFAGRETISESVTTRVRVAPLTLMFARSGVGKSSFLNCRLIPHLRSESAVTYLNEWGSDAPERLVEANLAALLREPRGIEQPVLVLDQFEDVFKSTDSRESLWDTLAGVTNISDGPAHILISMREEWLGAWQQSEDYLPDALNCLIRLRPLTDREILAAIVKPAASEGSVVFDSSLATRLAADLKRPSPFGVAGAQVEPGLMQLVCKRLWSVANHRGLKSIPGALYEELGGADMIVREFVWNELGSAGLKDKELPEPDRPVPRFSAADRVLWSGLTRHLIVAHGIKSIVSAEQIARSLLIADLGIAGRAVAEQEVLRTDVAYLDWPPEKRGVPAETLVAWIERVLEIAVDVGFMKRQRRFVRSQRASAAYVYELSHDALADIFQTFKIEFEGWIRTKLAKLVGAFVGAIVVLPLLIFALLTASWTDILGFAGVLIVFVVLMALYIAVLWVVGLILTALGRLVMHPVYRRLMRGRVPLKRIRRR